MNNKPESFQAYVEERDNPEGRLVSISSYNFLKAKLDEARGIMALKRELNNEDLRAQTEDLYRSRAFNLENYKKAIGLKETIATIEDALRVAETIKDMQRNADMPVDHELEQFIERENNALLYYQQALDQTSDAVIQNEASQNKRLTPQVMGMMEEDAHEEDHERSQE